MIDKHTDMAICIPHYPTRVVGPVSRDSRRGLSGGLDKAGGEAGVVMLVRHLWFATVSPAVCG
jgi:hypothetical protein